MKGPPIPASELINNCQGLVRSIAWKIHQKVPKNIDLDDLIGFGQLGLAQAARDFDQSREVQFTTYAYYRVRGAIFDGLSSMAWFSKADYSKGRYERSANEILEGALADEEASDASWFGGVTRSLSVAYLVTHVGGNTATEPVEPYSPTEKAELDDLRELIQQLIGSLPEQESTLIRAIYFDGLNIKQAGERIGVGKAWASRLHSQTLDRLALRLAASVDCGHSINHNKQLG